MIAEFGVGWILMSTEVSVTVMDGGVMNPHRVRVLRLAKSRDTGTVLLDKLESYAL
jgi:hypothetical protein